jgi:phosphatidylserine decarboxylase
MGANRLIASIVIAFGLASVAAAGYFFWRVVWFFRDPLRLPPAAQGLVSPADGVVVYVRTVGPRDDVVVIKQGVHAKVDDILREQVDESKLVIGVFMSPFDVHFNRAPLEGRVRFIRHHPGRGHNAFMGAMHWRILRRRRPYYAESIHIVQNERTVTCFDCDYRGRAFPLYVVQIGARTVNGIDSYFNPGDRVARGQTFGMIRVGSQVDLIAPAHGLLPRVWPGDRVRAGETIVAA